MFCEPPVGDDDVIVAGEGGDLEGYPGVVVSVLEEEGGCEEFSCSWHLLSRVVLDGPFGFPFCDWYLVSFYHRQG